MFVETFFIILIFPLLGLKILLLMVIDWKISVFNFGLQFYDVFCLLMSHYSQLLILPNKFLCCLYRKSILIQILRILKINNCRVLKILQFNEDMFHFGGKVFLFISFLKFILLSDNIPRPQPPLLLVSHLPFPRSTTSFPLRKQQASQGYQLSRA